MTNKKIEIELKRLQMEKEELVKRLDIVTSNIALLHKVVDKTEENLPALGTAAEEAMEALKRFTRTELVARIRHIYPDIEFSDLSIMKPLKKASDAGRVKIAQPSQGNKRQAIYEWIEK